MLRAVSLMDTDLEPDSWHLPCNCNKDWYVLLDLFGRSIPASEIQRDARHMLLRPLKELPPETCGLANSCTGKVAAAPFLMQVP